MRMIDADNIKGCAKYIKTNENFEQYIMIVDLVKLLDEQPTAYDIDKVVEELELHSFELGADTLPAHYVRLNEAIKIVKQGGVSDDVCEWKSDCHLENDNPAEWLISPHKPKRIFSTDIMYCPYCGKKIKVVE